MDDIQQAFDRLAPGIARLTAERDACDEARMGHRTWPVGPFAGIRWRRTDDPEGRGRTLLEVAWYDPRDQVRISVVQVDEKDRSAFTFVGGDEPGDDEDRILALLSYHYALASRAGGSPCQDEAP